MKGGHGVCVGLLALSNLNNTFSLQFFDSVPKTNLPRVHVSARISWEWELGQRRSNWCRYDWMLGRWIHGCIKQLDQHEAKSGEHLQLMGLIFSLKGTPKADSFVCWAKVALPRS